MVGSRWEIGDDATTCLQFVFHRLRREQRLTDRDALRAAQLWMLDPDAELPAELKGVWRGRTTRLADPSYWAAFTHHGS